MVFVSCASAANVDALSLKIAVLNPAVTGRVEVRVTTTNDSDHQITYYNTNACNYSFIVTAATGTTVPETEERKRLNCGSKGGLEITGRRINITLKPGESSSEDLRLLEFNDLSLVGVYSVQVERTFPSIGHFKSSSIKINVQP